MSGDKDLFFECLAATEADTEKIRNEYYNISAQYDSVNKQIAQIEKERDDALRQVASLEAGVREKQQLLDEKVAALQGREQSITLLENWINEKVEIFKKQKNELRTLKEDGDMVKQKLQEAQDHVLELQHQLSDSQKECDAIKQTVIDCENKIAVLNQQKLQIEGEMQECERRVLACQNLMASKDIEIEQLRQEIKRNDDTQTSSARVTRSTSRRVTVENVAQLEKELAECRKKLNTAERKSKQTKKDSQASQFQPINTLPVTDYYHPINFYDQDSSEPVLKSIPFYTSVPPYTGDALLSHWMSLPNRPQVTIGAVLGEGSFGDVKLVHQADNCSAVVKVFYDHPRSNKNYILSMTHELDVHQRVRAIDPEITTRVFDACAFMGHFACIVYERFGKSIADGMVDNVTLHQSVLRKFYVAFSNGVYHLDLSTKNILYEESEDGQISVRLADWGVAMCKTANGKYLNTGDNWDDELRNEMSNPVPDKFLNGQEGIALYHDKLNDVLKKSGIDYFVQFVCVCMFMYSYVFDPNWNLRDYFINDVMAPLDSELSDDFKRMLRNAFNLENMYGSDENRHPGCVVARSFFTRLTVKTIRPTQMFVHA